MSATCCRHGEAPTSWPVLRSCRLSFEIVAHANTMAVTKSANATSVGCRLGRRMLHQHEHRRSDHHRQNADAGDRAVRRADEPGHVAADRRDHEPADEDERERDDRERQRLARERRAAQEGKREPRGDRQAHDRERVDPGGRQVAVALVRSGRAARRRQRRHQPADDGPGQRDERPDRRNADGARADEADLMTPHVRGMRGEVHAGGRRQIAVRIGTATTHAMTRPVNIASPTDRPTRWPAPNSASDHAMS